jgi:hypothetical protein
MHSIQIRDHVRSVIDPDGAVLLDLRAGKYYSLNGVAAEIWVALEAGHTAPEIEARITERFSMPADAVSRDVAGFIRQLESSRLVDVRG